MAEEKSDVRIEERLKIKIGDAKNLPMRSHGSSADRDVYCTITLDQEEIFRTSTIEKTLNPFFAEEFQFSVPRKFRYLSVYVHDRDKTEKIVGKVSIRREDLHIYHNKDHWFQIKPVDQHTEVQGKVNLEVKFDNNIDLPSERLTVWVKECSDLTLTNGSCDPFAVVTVRKLSGKCETRKTKLKKKTNSPTFDEHFTFEMCSGRGSESRYNISQEGSWCELLVTLYHDSGGSNTFIGEVRVPLQQLTCINAWYLLQPGRKNFKSESNTVCSDLGSLRLKIHYTKDYVLASHLYNELRDLVLHSSVMQQITSSVAFLLGEIIPNKLEVAQPLVRLFLHHGMIVPYMKALATWEISKTTDTNTIFRGNTIVSKMMDETMRLAGLHYLHETLKPIIETIIAEKKSCEIDPSKILDISTLQTNLNNLKEYVENIFKAITSSALSCPPVLCELFHELREIATNFFPDNKEVRYSVVSGFIILRFFAPAILGPRLFDITTEQIDGQTHRTLMLISKTIQSLCNLVTSKSYSFKEEYMVKMFETFYTDTHVAAVRQYLEIISVSSYPTQKSDSPIVLKEGWLKKRAHKKKTFGKKQYHRYFRLTTQELSYAKQKGREASASVPVSQILGVERLEHDSFKKNNMFQIVQSQQILYVQANNCVDEKEWVDLLSKMCYTNHQRLRKFHPGAYINNHWPCCKQKSEMAEGCTQDSGTVRLSMNIDSDKELARLHSLVFQYMDNIQAFIRCCESWGELGHENNEKCLVEDPKSSADMLKSLQDISHKLFTEIRNYLRRVEVELKYGSKQAPIGDDNYLKVLSGRFNDVSMFQT